MLEIVKQAARDKGLVYKETLSVQSLIVRCQIRTPSGIVVHGLSDTYPKPYIGSDDFLARQAREAVLAKLRDDELVASAVERSRILNELREEGKYIDDLVELDLFAGQEPEEVDPVEPTSPVAREALGDEARDARNRLV